MLNYELLDENLRDTMRRYIEHRVPPGHFLQAVLSNDLHEACARADWENRHKLFDLVSWLHNEAPSTCWGSPERFQAWLSAREL